MKRYKDYDYMVTREGRVFSLKTNKEIYQWRDNTGYMQVRLFKDGKKKCFRVHRIVAELFIPNPNNKKMVNHIDGDKTNNTFENLEWVTNKENTQHGYDNNMYKSTYRCEVDVFDKNWNYIKTFPSIRSLSEELGLNRKTVTSILKKEKITNNYNYNFEYKCNRQQTIEKVS